MNIERIQMNVRLEKPIKSVFPNAFLRSTFYSHYNISIRGESIFFLWMFENKGAVMFKMNNSQKHELQETASMVILLFTTGGIIQNIFRMWQ